MGSEGVGGWEGEEGGGVIPRPGAAGCCAMALAARSLTGIVQLASPVCRIGGRRLSNIDMPAPV